jgi:hypothetical protein
VTRDLDRLPKRSRRVAEATLATDEDLIRIFEGRSKQALLVTDRQLLLLKPGMMAGAALSVKVASFALDSITAINLHTGPGIAALELVTADYPATQSPDLRSALQLPNWLPCSKSIATSPLLAELRAYVQSGGRSRSARAALGDA